MAYRKQLLILKRIACFFSLGSSSYLAFSAESPMLPSRQDSAKLYYTQPAGLSDDYPSGSPIEKVTRDLETAREAGAKHFRFGMSWTQIEAEEGNFDWEIWDDIFALASKYGITPLPYICYTPQWASSVDDENYWRAPPKDPKVFGDFVERVVSRYRGKASSWEIWNEPDNQAFWSGDVEQFAKIAEAGAKAVHRADRHAKVVLGGLSRGPYADFFEDFSRHRRILRLFDVINIHGYHETWEPETTESYGDKIEKTSAIMKNAGAKADLWLAEFGYSNTRYSKSQVSEWVDVHYDYEHTPAFQAKMLWRHHIAALASGKLSLTTWYRVNDLPKDTVVIGDGNNRFLGVLDIRGKKKPAFYSLKIFNHFFQTPSRKITQSTVIAKPEESQSIVEVFERKDGKIVVTAWLRSSFRHELKDKSGMAKDRRSENLTVTLPIDDINYAESCNVGEPYERRLPCTPISRDAITDNKLHFRIKGGEVFTAIVSP